MRRSEKCQVHDWKLLVAAIFGPKMFNNLKKRVEQEGGEGLLSAVATGAISGFRSPHSSIRSTSRESLVDSSDRKLSVSSVSTPIPEESSSNELRNRIARLQTALDRQQAGFDRRMKKNDEEWDERMKAVEKNWQTKYDVLKENLTAVLDKNARLEEQWPALESRAKEGEGFKEKLMVVQDEFDNLQSLQNQEIAKVKHLLLQKENDFTVALERYRALEESLAQSRLENDSLSKDLLNFKTSQRSCSELQDKCDSLRFQLSSFEAERSSEQRKNESTISELREKIASLESRLAASELGGDDRVQALTLEQTALEKKLEEAREQLSNIKTTWSSKIDSLERQIEHLNASKAEESAENDKLGESLAEARRSLKEFERISEEFKVKSLELDAVERENCHLIAELDTCKSDNETLVEKLQKSEEALAQKAQQIQEKEKESSIARNQVESLEKQIENLQSKNSSILEELVTANTAKESFEIQLNQAQGLVSTLESSLKDVKEQLITLEKAAESAKSLAVENNKLEADLTSLRKTISDYVAANEDLSSQLSSLHSSHDEVLLRNAEISQELEMERRNHKATEDKLQKSDSQIRELQSRLSEAEQMTDDKVEKLDAVIKIRNTMELLEEQLGERNKTIRLQNQRINDMKKALQKELNSKANGSSKTSMGDSSSEETIGFRRELPPPTLAVTSQDDVNFTYMKNVVLHILTSKGTEALHMTKALATVLKLSMDEERLVRDTLEWRLSWFGPKPDVQKFLP
ncbi:unnamed protein product [Notodromas monacha]|uniref:GRIP domain-containing protein n=1 Tax=Notodromas monacha TaxID=399045 RepID=A0A7R9BIA6_9CRUS|nr:unnamed protein product [Notodromas monacha]CAG0916009.1 unnamed protein product [Notodromas monacha]